MSKNSFKEITIIVTFEVVVILAIAASSIYLINLLHKGV